MKQRILGIVQAVLIGLIVLSGAIALPILFRPFYYWHIGPLGLTELVELTPEQIKTAYNEVMNFCIGWTDTFSAGALPFSVSGAEHFSDVQKLFVLDLRVLVMAGLLLIVLRIFFPRGNLRLASHTPGFWGAVGLSVTGLILGAIAALDFDKAFFAFHKLFFPGKDNWLFDGRQDPVIYMLPEEFFRNCAILILSGILLSCVGLLLWDWRVRHK